MSTLLMFRKALHWTYSTLSISGGSLPPLRLSPLESCLNQTRSYAARKGTIEKRRKLKQARKLKEVKKDLLPIVGKKFASKVQVTTLERTEMFHGTREPIDDVWIQRFHKRMTYPILDAIEMHRELHHPSMLDLPDAPLYLKLELDMSLDKKNKFLDVFSGIVANPHLFSSGRERKLMAFCKNEQGQSDALLAGANITGGANLIKQVQSGEVIISEFDYIVSHTDMINELQAIRGILKRLYPTPAKGALGVNMSTLVERFKMGIEYKAEKDSIHHNFGCVEVFVGPLSMPAEHLEANIGAVVETICTHRHAHIGPFITIALLLSPPSKENFAIDISKYTPKVEVDEDEDLGEEIKQ